MNQPHMHTHFTVDLLYCGTILYKVVPFPRKKGMSHVDLKKQQNEWNGGGNQGDRGVAIEYTKLIYKLVFTFKLQNIWKLSDLQFQ